MARNVNKTLLQTDHNSRRVNSIHNGSKKFIDKNEPSCVYGFH